MLIGTSRTYMNSATKNDYVRNRFPEDKNDMIELHEICIDNDIPLIVFAMMTDGNMKRAVMGEVIGTYVGGKDND